jgi:hypothetical protein
MQFFYDFTRALLVILLFCVSGLLNMEVIQMMKFYLLIMAGTYIVYFYFFFSLFPENNKN